MSSWVALTLQAPCQASFVDSLDRGPGWGYTYQPLALSHVPQYWISVWGGDDTYMAMRTPSRLRAVCIYQAIGDWVTRDDLLELGLVENG